MKGVAPAVCPVIVIVVSSASVAPARWEKTVKTAATTINKHVFIIENEIIRYIRLPGRYR